jgi:UDP-N-acetyl-alpha-D-quinovosamine dehydrogenase
LSPLFPSTPPDPRGSARRVLVTGATGFIGSASIERLNAMGLAVRGSVRGPSRPAPAVETFDVGELGSATDWSRALASVDVVIHTAARVHMMSDTASDPLAEHRRVNVEGTLNLARQAVAASVRRFVFLSTIKVNGDRTEPGVPFKADDPPAPTDPYAISKWEAENGLRDLASRTGLEVVIIRPPLVYGPGVKANFLGMMRWLRKGLPLPFGAVKNSRSFVALENLVDLLGTCARHPGAANQIFLASDGEDLSTSALLSRLAMALGRPARLIPVPMPALRGAALLLGKREVFDRLCSSLQVEISKNRQLLSWVPRLGVDEALRATARHFLKEYSNH